jgi:hypothetical protein
MTKRRFGKGLGCATILAVTLVAPAALAQKSDAAQDADSAPKPGKPINAGDVLSGELNAMLVRAGQTGKRVETYQITSEPRRLPPPNGLCNLETGPETFELVTTSNAQTAQLKAFVGREISVRIDEVACAQDAGEMSEAVVTKWRVVTKR